jgi:ABC-type Fe3+/spermidine/putrescine transport system ATPase subunit
VYFFCRTNIFEGRVVTAPSGEGTGVGKLANGRLACCLPRGLKAQARVQLLIRPEGIQILESKPENNNNVLSGEILLATFQGDSVEYQIRVGEQECRVKSDGLKEFARRRQVFLHLPPERCLVIEKSKSGTASLS